MEMIIKPYLQVGELIFGTKQSELRELHKPFIQHKKGNTVYDDFEKFSAHIYYDKQDGMEAIEFYNGANPIFLEMH